jgi:tetratricopeptide (TPR) repeat protein
MNCIRPSLQPLLPARALAVLAIAAAASAWTPAQAVERSEMQAKGYTTGELALLPEWCIDSQDGPYGSPEGADYMNRSPRARQWVGLMGGDFWHMHHYCRGLRNMMRLRSGNAMRPELRTGLIENTIAEFNYVIGNCGEKMPLLPEVYLKLGEVFLMQENLPSAQTAFERSRELKPDYWPAYDRWIQVLIRLKRWETARELTLEGLRNAPNEPNLTARLKTIEAAAGRGKGTAKPASVAQSGDARP